MNPFVRLRAFPAVALVPFVSAFACELAIAPLTRALDAQPAIQSAPQVIPANALAVSDAVLPAAKPAVRSWIVEEGNRVAAMQGSATALEGSAKASIAKRFTGQAPSALAQNALIAAIMVQAVKVSNAEKAATLQKMQAYNEIAAFINAQQARLAEASAQLAASESQACALSVCSKLRSEHVKLAKQEAVVKYGVKIAGAAAVAAVDVDSKEARAALTIEMKKVAVQTEALQSAAGAAVVAAGTTAAAIAVVAGAAAAATITGVGAVAGAATSGAISAGVGAAAAGTAVAGTAAAGTAAAGAAATAAAAAAGSAGSAAAGAASSAAASAANTAGSAASSAGSQGSKAVESVVSAIAKLF